MNKTLTEIAYVLDRSGSMETMQDAAIAGFNQFLQSQLDEPGDVNLSLLLFNERLDLIHDRAALHEVRPLDDATYVPRGMTALLDAVGSTIKGLGRKLAKEPEERRPGKVIVAIYTDGLENVSRKYDLNKINQMITHQREKYSWEFLFLAANQDAIATACMMGIDPDMAANAVYSRRGFVDTSRTISRKVSSIRKASYLKEFDADYHKPMSEIIEEEKRKEE